METPILQQFMELPSSSGLGGVQDLVAQISAKDSVDLGYHNYSYEGAATNIYVRASAEHRVATAILTDLLTERGVNAVNGLSYFSKEPIWCYDGQHIEINEVKSKKTPKIKLYEGPCMYLGHSYGHPLIHEIPHKKEADGIHHIDLCFSSDTPKEKIQEIYTVTRALLRNFIKKYNYGYAQYFKKTIR